MLFCHEMLHAMIRQHNTADWQQCIVHCGICSCLAMHQQQQHQLLLYCCGVAKQAPPAQGESKAATSDCQYALLTVPKPLQKHHAETTCKAAYLQEALQLHSVSQTDPIPLRPAAIIDTEEKKRRLSLILSGWEKALCRHIPGHMQAWSSLQACQHIITFGAS